MNFESIGIIIAFLSFPLFVIGLVMLIIQTIRKKKKKVSLIIVLGSVLLFFGGFGIFAIGNTISASLAEAVTILPLIVGVALLSWFIYRIVTTKKKRQAAENSMSEKQVPVQPQKVRQPSEAERFYELCKKAGVKDVSTAEGQARLNLCVKNNNLDLDESVAIEKYLLGKTEAERRAKEDEDAREAAVLKDLNEKERVFEEATKRYVTCYGQEKAVKMCLDEAAMYRQIVSDCDKQRKSVMSGANATYMSGKQQEHSWAIHGGIASGIAGGAAGLATAIHIQQKNETIRASNQALAGSVASLAADAITEIYKQKEEAEKNAVLWEKRAENAKSYLVHELPANDLLIRLSPVLIKQVQSKTGAVEVYVKLHSTPNLCIFDNVTAVVDGCIKAILWDGEKKMGEAFFALPYHGATKDCELSSICRSSELKGNQKYTITFESERLWAIETHDKVYDPVEEAKKEEKRKIAAARYAEEQKQKREQDRIKYAKPREAIMRVLTETGSKMDISEILQATPELKGYTNVETLKVVQSLMADGLVGRIEEKRKAYFQAR